MSIFRPFAQARTVLGVGPDADAATIKRAYRKLVLAHPPDTDPAGFRRVRDAYELLTEPGSRIHDLLLQPAPTVEPPPLPAPAELPEPVPLPLVLLRIAAARADAAALLDPSAPAPSGPRAARKKTDEVPF